MDKINKKKILLVYIIVINWNEERYTAACLESLRKVKYGNLKVVVVDNGSKIENYKSLYKKYSGFAAFIRLESNKGFTGGNNVGIKYALDRSAEFIMLLNNDTEVNPDFLSKLMESMIQDENIGIIGPKINYMDDKNLLWCIGGKLRTLTGNGKLIWNKHKDTYKKKMLVDVDYVSGCAMLVRSKIFRKIGFLDNKYFIYNEESDFNLRAKRSLGVRRVCRLDSVIYHKVSLTNTKISGFAEYYLTRNRMYFARKHNNNFRYAIFLIYFFAIIVPKYTLFYPIYYRNIKILKYFYVGIKDYFNGQMGKSGLF